MEIGPNPNNQQHTNKITNKTSEENKSNILIEETNKQQLFNDSNITAATTTSYGSKNVLSPNININNRRSPPTSPANIITMSTSSSNSPVQKSSPPPKTQVPDLLRNVAPGDVISYQRVKKIVIDTSSLDDEIRARENYLNHLKSIDLDKYSFPNEHLPKTDYTYARTSSYLSECKHLIDDSLGMPNLCRRARKSPNTSFTSPTSSNQPTPPTSPSIFSSSHLNVFSSVGRLFERVSSPLRLSSSPISEPPTVPAETRDIIPTVSSPKPSPKPIPTDTNDSSGFYDYFRSAFTNTIERSRRFSFTSHSQQTNPNATSPLRSPTPKRVTFKESPEIQQIQQPQQQRPIQSSNKLNRSLSKELDVIGGGEMSRQETRKDPVEMHSSSRMILRGAAASSGAVRRQTGVKSTADRATMTNGDGGDEYVLYGRSSDASLATFCCSRLFWLLLLLLIPLLFFAAARLDETTADSTASRMKNFRWYLEPNEKAFADLVDLCRRPFDAARFLLCDCLPGMFVWFFALLIRSPPSSDSSANRIFFGGDLVPDFKPATSGGYDMSLNILSSSNQTEIVSQLNTMKEKIMSEIMLSMGENTNQLDLVRRELDQKFNYTLTLMLNKLADQIEATREQESELSRVKSVLDELDTRYKTILTRLHEQSELIKKYEQTALPNQQQHQQQQQQQQENIRESFSDDHVSFRTLEEYVHRTFQIYNADRTGKTDFASESIGGSILFTRCTETYMDNARWFTVFDVPITRITVSPRVVIQNSIQPGNCWSFKGAKADLFVKLAAKITPTSFSIEHIPKELSLTGLIDSAPQNFTIYGYESKDLIADDKRLLLGNYRYDNESKNTLQFFDAQHFYPDTPIAVVELKIESNAGNKDYTCLYKFRVHGRLFKSDYPTSDSGSEKRESNGETVETETTHRRQIHVESSSSSSTSNSNSKN